MPLSAIAMRSARDPGDELELGSAVDRERGEIAGVDAEHGCPERDAAVELLGVVCLDERVEAEPRGDLHQVRDLGVVEIAQQQQRRVGARVPRGLEMLVGREEPLGEERGGRRGACRSQVVPRAAEALVDEHRDRRRSGGGVGGGDQGRVGVRAQVAGRRRAALDLGDRTEAGLRERVVEPSHQPDSAFEKVIERIEAARGRARVDRLAAEPEALAEIVGEAGGDERRRGVQQHGVAAAAALAREHRADRRGVLRRRAAAQLGGIGGLDPEIARVELPLAHVAVDDLDDEARAVGRELVEPAFAVDDERAPRPELCERLGVRGRELGGVDAEDAVAGARRVRERARGR